MILDGQFNQNKRQTDEYVRKLDNVLVDSSGLNMYNDDKSSKQSTPSRSKLPAVPKNMKLVPELYYVPRESIAAEKKNPHSQARFLNLIQNCK